MQSGGISALKMIKSTTKSSIRINGLRLYESMAIRCTQVEGCISLVRSLLNAAQGKGGQLTLISQRVLVLLALNKCGQCIRTHTFTATPITITTTTTTTTTSADSNESIICSLAGEVISILITSLDKEVDEVVKAVVARVLYTWLLTTTTTIHTSTFIDIVKNSINKNKTSSFYLLLVCVLLCRRYTLTSTGPGTGTLTGSGTVPGIDSFLAPFDALTTELITLVKESVKHPLAVQPTIPLALELLLHISTVSSTTLTAMTSNKLWTVVTSSTSAIHILTYLQSNLLNGFKSTTAGLNKGACFSITLPPDSNVSTRPKPNLKPSYLDESLGIHSFDQLHLATLDLGEEESDVLEADVCTFHTLQAQTQLLCEGVGLILLLTARLQPTVLTAPSVYEGAAKGKAGLVNTITTLLLHPCHQINRVTALRLEQVFTLLTQTDVTHSKKADIHEGSKLSLHLLKLLLEHAAYYSNLTQPISVKFVKGESEGDVSSGKLSIPASSTWLRAVMSSVVYLHIRDTSAGDESGGSGSSGVWYVSIDDPVVSGSILGSVLVLLGHHLLGLGPGSHHARYLCEELCEAFEGLPEVAYIHVGTVITTHLFSSSAPMRLAAQYAISLLLLHFPLTLSQKIVLQTVFPGLVTALESCDLTHLSADDLYKYHHPEAAIAAALARTEVKEEEIKITNADRKKDGSRGARRGQFGGDSNEDDEWAERIRLVVYTIDVYIMYIICHALYILLAYVVPKK